MPPPELLELVERALRGSYHQYALMAGSMALRTAIAGKLAALYSVKADPATEITVTSGATEAIFDAIQAVVRRDDEVIVFDPCYDSYEPSITLAGGRTVHLPLTQPGFAIDWERLRAALNPRTRLVIVNSPHNPSGALLKRADFDRLAELLRPYDCYLLSDEVYEHVVFDGARHATALAQPELAQRCFAVFSFGKTYHATGWKLGYCVAPPALSAELRRVHQYVTFASTSPLQQALAEYMTAHPEHHLELPAFYQERRDYFAGLLAGTKFRPLRAAGDVLPARGLQRDLDVARRRVRALAHDRARRGDDPGVRVLRAAARRAARSVLFRQGKRDTRRCGRALAAAVAAAGAVTRGVAKAAAAESLSLGGQRNGRAVRAGGVRRRGVG